jgi:hypothetical protein
MGELENVITAYGALRDDYDNLSADRDELKARVAELEAALTDVRRTEALSAHAYDLISAVLSRFELNQTDKTAGRYIDTANPNQGLPSRASRYIAEHGTMEPGSQTPPP